MTPKKRGGAKKSTTKAAPTKPPTETHEIATGPNPEGALRQAEHRQRVSETTTDSRSGSTDDPGKER